MEEKFLKPVEPGAIVRFPGNPNRVLRPEGEQVAITPFWLRRIKGGEVAVVNNKPNQEETNDHP